MTYRSCILTTLAVFAASSSALRAEDKKASPPFVHTVIFYLKADTPSSVTDEIITDCHELLAKIPTVRMLKAGRPAEGAGGITKKDYAVGLVILFDDAAALKTYAEHPNHRKLVAKYFKYFDPAKVAAFDFVDAKK